jgi:hypothetical protein
MISTNEIAKMITDPASIAMGNHYELEELSKKYPYTQLFSILLLKSLKSNNDITFEEKLTQHSFRISDRVQLYSLIQENAEFDTETIEQDSKLEEIVQEVKKEDPIIQEIKPETEIEIIEEEESIELVKEKETSDSEKEVLEKPDDVLEENILHNVYAAGFQLEELTEEEEARLLQKKEVKTEAETNQEIEIHLSADSELSFSGWLHSNSNYEDEITTDKDEIFIPTQILRMKLQLMKTK